SRLDRWDRKCRMWPQFGSDWTPSALTTRPSSGSIQPVARRMEDNMTPSNQFASLFHLLPLLRWVIALASGVGFSLLSIGPAATAGPAPNPSELAASAAPSGAPFALEEARAAKRTAASYRAAGALSKAAASWTHAAQAYEGVGNFGEAALAWTEAASIHEQQNEPQGQVQAL